MSWEKPSGRVSVNILRPLFQKINTATLNTENYMENKLKKLIEREERRSKNEIIGNVVSSCPIKETRKFRNWRDGFWYRPNLAKFGPSLPCILWNGDLDDWNFVWNNTRSPKVPLKENEKSLLLNSLAWTQDHTCLRKFINISASPGNNLTINDRSRIFFDVNRWKSLPIPQSPFYKTNQNTI